ncbi:MAG: hypothetical protein GX293_13570 [Bacteroidales bacterium]|nr:hypothetical protein [Bacteroidales bacterium]
MPEDEGHNYLLNIIDIYSRYAFGDGLKAKDENSVLSVFKKYTSIYGVPKEIQTVSVALHSVISCLG